MSDHIATPTEPSPVADAVTPRATRGVRTAIRDAHVDPLVDLLRAVAIVRVFLWHASGATGLTLIAAMPLMFFVMGSRLPSSVDRHLHADVLHRRGRRLLVPFWAYAIAAVGAATLAGAIPAGEGIARSLGHLATWLVPLGDPTLADFGAGWLTNHLWYLRTYLWILLCLPLVAAASRRPVRSVVAAVAVVALISGPWRSEVPFVGSGTGRVLLGDLVAYGTFAVLGMVWFRRLGSSGAVLGGAARRVALAIAVTGAVATAVWVWTQGLGPSGVNGSYPAILLTGATWLAALALAQPQLSRLAAVPAVARASATVRRRALTIYLWHPAAIFAVRSLLGSRAWPERPGLVPMVLTVGLSALATVAIAAVVGGVENLGQRRVLAHLPHHVPHPSLAGIRRGSAPALARVAAGVVAFAVAVPALPGIGGELLQADAVAVTAGASAPTGRVLRAPSYREALAADAFASPMTSVPTTAMPNGTEAPAIVAMAAGGLAARVPRLATTRRRTTRRVAATATTVGNSAPSTSVPQASGARASSAIAASAKAPSAIGPSALTTGGKATSAKAPSAIPAPGAPDGARVATAARTVVPTAAKLDRAVDAWFADTPGLDGAAVTVLFGDTSWSGVVRRRGQMVLDTSTPFLTLSITKTFTAALVLREVEKGTLSLDGALPDLPGVAERPGVTVRRLLTHESGLPDYLEVPAFNPRDFLDPRSALALSLGAPALSKPGTAVHYANSNYLWLHLLLEKVTGRTYAQLVGALTDELGLRNTEVRAVDRTGWPGGGAGAIWSSTEDLAVWLRELMTPGSVLRPATLKAMRTLDDLNIGLGLWPACPCGTDASGNKVYIGIGHHIGEGGMYFLPAVGGVVVVHSGPNGDVSILGASDLAARINEIAQA